MKQLRVTEEQFGIICAALVMLEAEGYDPKTCTRKAFRRAGVKQPSGDVEIVIDREPPL